MLNRTNVLCSLTCCRKLSGELQYHLNVCEKLADIEMINGNCRIAFLQQIYVNKTLFPCAISCLCNTTVIPTGDSLNSKTYKSVNLQSASLYR